VHAQTACRDAFEHLGKERAETTEQLATKSKRIDFSTNCTASLKALRYKRFVFYAFTVYPGVAVS